MSFQGLISGSECATPLNPLSQVLKHTEGDRSIQQDRVAGPSTSRLQHLPGTSTPAASEHDLALARQFFGGNVQAPPIDGTAALPIQPHLAMMAQVNTSESPVLSEAWSREQQQQQHLAANAVRDAQSSWVTEFGTEQSPFAASPTQRDYTTIPQDAQYQPYVGYGSPMPLGLYGPHMGQRMLSSPLVSEQGKGKDKIREADFEAAFAQVASSLAPAQTDTSKTVETSSAVEELANSLADTKLEATTEKGNDVEAVAENSAKQEDQLIDDDIAAWEAEMNQLMSAEREEGEFDYGESMQRAWENQLQESEPEGLKMDDDGLPVLGPYVFDPKNKFLAAEHQSLLKDARALLDGGGSLSEAALMLEAAIQKGDFGEGGYEAWILLGETRTMDEREDLGLRALAEGVKIAEAAGSRGPGILSMATSYTNEGYDRASYVMLLRWLQAQFPSHPVPPEMAANIRQNALWDAHARLTDLFIDLACSQHRQGFMDPDVQIGLGILFYTDGDFDRARDCFRAALTARPKDFLLWNRLGSSLSNGKKPEEALGAYREALHLRPTYTRAIYNVGVACLNIGAHKEAAEHFLSALGMQDATGGGTSEQLWSILRRAFEDMERPDLVNMCATENRANVEAFRKEGFDF